MLSEEDIANAMSDTPVWDEIEYTARAREIAGLRADAALFLQRMVRIKRKLRADCATRIDAIEDEWRDIQAGIEAVHGMVCQLANAAAMRVDA